MTTNVPESRVYAVLEDGLLLDIAARLGTTPERLISAGIEFMAFYAAVIEQDGIVAAVIGDEWKKVDINLV